MCHCLACQRRTGSAFGIQARFDADHVIIAGRFSEYVRISDEGEERIFHFCPDCGATVFYENDSIPDTIAIALGAFDDPYFVTPTVSVYEERQHEWLEIAGNVEHYD